MTDKKGVLKCFIAFQHTFFALSLMDRTEGRYP